MAARLMHGLLSALRRGWHQGGDALHPDPRPALREALRDTSLATAHTVTQVTQDAERVVYPQFRVRLLRMAAEDRGHVTWLRETLLARGGAIPTGACPPAVAPTSGAALRREMAAARHASEALLELMHLAEQADPEMAALERARALHRGRGPGVRRQQQESSPPHSLWCVRGSGPRIWTINGSWPNGIKLSSNTSLINELRASHGDRVAVSRIGSALNGAG